MSTSQPPPTPKPRPEKLGLREQGKQDKRRRIKAAARQEFMRKGYAAATTRDIASRAEISIGTLFVYAKDKRELLMMILNDDLDRVGSSAEQAIDVQSDLLEQVIGFFAARYRYWAARPNLGRPIVTEIFDVVGSIDQYGPETARFYARRQRTVAALRQCIEQGQKQGTVANTIASDLIASLFMTIYLTEVRRWLNQEKPDADQGIEQLRTLLALAIRGINP